jgi:hypothetical protein
VNGHVPGDNTFVPTHMHKRRIRKKETGKSPRSTTPRIRQEKQNTEHFQK